jgi:DNA polymerase III subunit alpha
MEAWRGLLERLGAASTAGLAEVDDGSEIYLGGILAARKLSNDRKGNPMAFVSLEDYTGTVECIAFSQAYADSKRALSSDAPLLLRGRVSTREQEKPKILLEEAHILAELIDAGRAVLHLAVSTSQQEERMRSLLELLKGHEGRCPVVLHVDHTRLGGMQVRPREIRVRPESGLLAGLEQILGPSAVRVTVGEFRGRRSAEIFPVVRTLPKRSAAPPEPEPAGLPDV